MGKINDLLYNIRDGARTNKYRILLPGEDNDFSRNMDILCKSTSIPGREITPVDVTIKGRKAQIAGETSLSGSWTATFYNTKNMDVRIFFDDWIKDIHRLDVPDPVNNGLLGLEALNDAVREVNNTINAFQNTKNKLTNLIDDPINGLFGGSSTPIYQREITIQQLGANDEEKPFEITLLNAFPISISEIELSDETPGISETTVTFAYSNFVINRQLPSTAEIFLGDAVGGLF